jgi:hypothetical protein
LAGAMRGRPCGPYGFDRREHRRSHTPASAGRGCSGRRGGRGRRRRSRGHRGPKGAKCRCWVLQRDDVTFTRPRRPEVASITYFWKMIYI